MGYIESWTPTNENRGMCTDEEMHNYLQNMNFTIKLEHHQGPKKSQWNLVLYFDPFPQKYLNYMSRWEAKKTLVWKTVEHDQDEKHDDDWIEEKQFAYRKGPYGRGIYMGIKLQIHANFRDIDNYPEQLPFKLHNWLRDGYDREIIKTRFHSKKRWWTFYGTNASQFTVSHNQSETKFILPCNRLYDGSGGPKPSYNPRTSFNYYKFITPLSYREAARGYKVLPSNMLTYILKDVNGKPRLIRREGVIGCVIHYSQTRLSNNFLYGKDLHNKQNIRDTGWVHRWQ